MYRTRSAPEGMDTLGLRIGCYRSRATSGAAESERSTFEPHAAMSPVERWVRRHFALVPNDAFTLSATKHGSDLRHGLQINFVFASPAVRCDAKTNVLVAVQDPTALISLWQQLHRQQVLRTYDLFVFISQVLADSAVGFCNYIGSVPHSATLIFRCIEVWICQAHHACRSLARVELDVRAWR